MRLQVAHGHAGDGDAVTVAQLDYCIAMRIVGEQRRQLLHVLNVGEVVKLDGVGLPYCDTGHSDLDDV